MLYKYSYIAQYCVLELKNAEQFSFQNTEILVMGGGGGGRGKFSTKSFLILIIF